MRRGCNSWIVGMFITMAAWPTTRLPIHLGHWARLSRIFLPHWYPIVWRKKRWLFQTQFFYVMSIVTQDLSKKVTRSGQFQLQAFGKSTLIIEKISNPHFKMISFTALREVMYKTIYKIECIYGCFSNGGTPISHPKMIIFSRKTHGLLGKPPF